MDWWIGAGSALGGAVVGSFGSFLVQNRLGRLDQRRRLVLDHLQQLQSELHSTSFMVTELNKATRSGNPDEVRSTAYRIIERASATQMPKTTITPWHPAVASAVTEWETQIMAFAAGTTQALDSGDSSSEMRRAFEFVQARDEEDDFGLAAAVNELGNAIRAELTKKQ